MSSLPIKCSNLPIYPLSEWLEERANSFLKESDEGKKAGYVHVRILFNKQKETSVEKTMTE